MSWFDVSSAEPARHITGAQGYDLSIAMNRIIRRPSYNGDKRRLDCDPQAEAATPAAEFAHLVRASGALTAARCIPGLPPSVPLPSPVLAVSSAVWKTEPVRSTAATTQGARSSTGFISRRTFHDGMAMI
jgi:hypothetical protein